MWKKVAIAYFKVLF